MEGECDGRIGGRGSGIRISRGISDEFKKGIWKRGGRVSQSGGVEKAGTGGENNGRICIGVQKSGEGKWIQRTTVDGGV